MRRDGGPAFPAYSHDEERDIPGMTLRDCFAGQALAGLMVTPAVDVQTLVALLDTGSHPRHAEQFAERAYEIADAMIAAREVKP